MPTHPLTPQLACRSVPIAEKDNNEDSEIKYDSADTSGDNKENQPPRAPAGYIPNIPDVVTHYFSESGNTRIESEGGVLE